MKRSIQGSFSWNCIAALVTSNCVISGTVTNSAATAPASAIQRTVPACSSRPSASRTQPTPIGSQIATLNKPIVVSFECSSY